MLLHWEFNAGATIPADVHSPRFLKARRLWRYDLGRRPAPGDLRHRVSVSRLRPAHSLKWSISTAKLASTVA